MKDEIRLKKRLDKYILKPSELIEPIISDDNSPDYVKIRTYNGEEKTVSMEEINIEFNIKS